MTGKFESNKFKPEPANYETLWLNKCKPEEANFEPEVLKILKIFNTH